jgi:hypothetical protein
VSNALLRPFSISQHPLHDRRYRLPTPPIEALYRSSPKRLTGDAPA